MCSDFGLNRAKITDTIDVDVSSIVTVAIVIVQVIAEVEETLRRSRRLCSV
jgi:hypothetical protein